MAIEVRSIDAAEAETFARCTWTAFGGISSEERLARILERLDTDFAVAAFDQGRMVATASANPLELTLPAGLGTALPTITVPGVTAVGVLPTHRRQGLLTRVMHHQLADLRRQGYLLSVLLASESIIYGRFGYGAAQYKQTLVVEPARSAFRPEAAATAGEGRLRMVDSDEAAKMLPSVHDQARRRCPGELNRSERWWRWHLKDVESDRDHGNARLYAVHESAAGVADGWVSYRYHDLWTVGDLPGCTVVVDDLVATSPAARTALWRLVLDLDLVKEVKARERPMDEPLRWLLADPRRVQTTEVVDHLWVRLLDIPAALEARGYGAAERLVIEVKSPDPTAAGRFVLESGPASGSCRPAKDGEKASIVLGLADLGAMYLGGVTASVLVAAGRARELESGARAVADRVFASPVAPFCSLHF